MNKIACSLILVLCPLAVAAQLVVTVSPPKIVGNKAVVKLEMKNDFTNRIESARAAVFLLDEKGKMLGQSTKWVIGSGAGRPDLASDSTNSFNFVITASKPFETTNLTVKLTFNHLILDGGKLADPTRVVIVETAIK